MKPLSNIYGIRHLQTIDNQNNIHTGWAKTELLPEAIADFKNQIISGYKFKIIFCSTSHRTRETLKILQSNFKELFETNAVFYFSDDLREINFGTETKKKKGTINQQCKAHPEIKFPDGESYLELEERIKKFFLENQSKFSHSSPTLIVSHSGPLRVIQSLVKNQPLKTILHSKIPNGKIFKINTKQVD